jgi:hypothetical protein
MQAKQHLLNNILQGTKVYRRCTAGGSVGIDVCACFRMELLFINV